ncbi:MAG: hypothetical protein V1777_05005 [Candidatus Micrarchaeota archaeon]
MKPASKRVTELPKGRKRASVLVGAGRGTRIEVWENANQKTADAAPLWESKYGPAPERRGYADRRKPWLSTRRKPREISEKDLKRVPELRLIAERLQRQCEREIARQLSFLSRKKRNQHARMQIVERGLVQRSHKHFLDLHNSEEIGRLVPDPKEPSKINRVYCWVGYKPDEFKWNQGKFFILTTRRGISEWGKTGTGERRNYSGKVVQAVPENEQ